MLNSLRKATGSWIAIAFIFLLALSFAVWGIEDIFRIRADDTVISVGETRVSQEAYRNLMQQRVSEVSRNFGRQLSFEEARMLGVEGQIISQLLVDITLQEDARDLGLRISDEAIAQLIVEDPLFAGPNGQFSRQRLSQIINLQYGSEAALLRERRSTALREQIFASLTAGTTPSQTQLALLNRYQNERRAIRFITISADMVDAVEAPTEEQIAQYFEANATRYRAPQYREFSFIHVREADVLERIVVSDDEIASYYEQNQRAFTNPERRIVHQLNFDSLEAAAEARARIEAGETYDDLISERDLREDDYSLGLVTEGEVLDPAYSSAAFALALDEVSQAVEGRFGAALLRATEIQEAEVRPLEEVREDLRREIQAAQAGAELLDVFDEVEDQRAGGSTLQDAAAQLQLPFASAISSRDGLSQTGEQIADLPIRARLLNTVFETEIDVELDPLDAPDGFVWVNVDNIIADRDRTLDEVRDAVVRDWTAEQLRQRLNSRASEIVASLRQGSSIGEVASELGIGVLIAEDIAREGQSLNLSQSAVRLVFSTPRNGFAQASGAQENTRIVFEVTDARLENLEASEAIASQAAARVAEDMMLHYLTERQKDLGLEINDRNRRRALGEIPAGEQ